MGDTESTGVLGRLSRIDSRNEIAILAALLVILQLLPKSIGLGVYGLGIVSGAGLALPAFGIILIYRSNRIVNFAQLAIGGVGAVLFTASVTYTPLLRHLGFLCAGTCDSPVLVRLNYWFSLVVAFALAVGAGWLVHLFVVRRFSAAPRQVLTVATIFVVAALQSITALLVDYVLSTGEQRDAIGVESSSAARLPFEIAFRVGTVRFHAADVILVVVAGAAMLGLYAYLRYTAMGTAIRASAENDSRAETLGINVQRVTSRVWIIASMLSAAAALVMAARDTGPLQDALGATVLVRILAVAVVARFTSFPLALAASLVLGVFDQGTQAAYGSPAIFEGSLVFVICTVLLLRRRRASRAEAQAEDAWPGSREVRPIPLELRGLPTVRTWMRAGVVVLAVLVVGAPWLFSPAQNSLAGVYMIYAMVGLSLLVLTGWSGQISLGQLAFAAIGAFVTGSLDVPFLVMLPLAGFAGGLVALVVGFPALKLSGLYLGVSTLAFGIFVSQIVVSQRYLGKHLHAVRRPDVLGLDFEDQRTFYYLTLAVLVLVILAVVGLRRSRTARALIAARDNERAAQSFGISLVRARLTAFTVSGFLSGLAGSLFAYHQHGVPSNAFTADASLLVFQHSVVGGLGSIAGPLIGQVSGALPSFVTLPIWLALAIGGPAALVVLLAVPGGMAQFLFDVRDDMLRRLAKRERILVPSLVADVNAALDTDRAPVVPKASTGSPYVPVRYRLRDQWALHVQEPAATSAAEPVDEVAPVG